MMRPMMAALLLAWVVRPASAQTTADSCQPQPDCRILYSTLKPGQPRTPLSSKEGIDLGLKPGDVHIQNTPTSTLRIPLAPE
jgi:hypothetical protein